MQVSEKDVRRVIAMNGIDYQINKWLEEAFELLEACELHFDGEQVPVEAVIDEIADVRIMAWHIASLWDYETVYKLADEGVVFKGLRPIFRLSTLLAHHRDGKAIKDEDIKMAVAQVLALTASMAEEFGIDAVSRRFEYKMAKLMGFVERHETRKAMK